MQSPLDIKWHPLDLREHGKTPSGLSLYRIVWADSRASVLYHEGKRFEFQRYEDQPATMGKWILEKWLSPEKYIGMTREDYEKFLASMPGAASEGYPVDGEYELVHIFADHVDPIKVHELIAHMEWRLRNVSLEDRKKEVYAEAAQRKEAQREAKGAILDEILGRETKEEKVRTYVH